jgi:hypothetical protein
MGYVFIAIKQNVHWHSLVQLTSWTLIIMEREIRAASRKLFFKLKVIYLCIKCVSLVLYAFIFKKISNFYKHIRAVIDLDRSNCLKEIA